MKKRLFFFSLFLVMIPAMFTSCIIGEAILRLAGWYDAPAVFSQLDDGGKLVEKRKPLEDADFQGSNFFIKDTPNEYFIDLNGQVLNLIKKDLKNGSFSPYSDKDYEKYMKELGIKEAISYWPSDGIIIFYKEFQKKDGKNGTMSYGFAFDIDQQAYKEWNENLAYLKKCDEQIESCNWTIENCSAETLKKSKVVQVPYEVTERRWVPGDLGARTNGSFGSTAITPGHYEYDTYTIYKEETQYYTVANPNYNPAKVAQAKQNLPSWQNSKSATLEKMKYLPFTLINLGEGED